MTTTKYPPQWRLCGGTKPATRIAALLDGLRGEIPSLGSEGNDAYVYWFQDLLWEVGAPQSRANDALIKTLEQRDRQIDNQAETIESLRQTVNRYAARINELQELVQAMKETTDAATALSLRTEDNRRRAAEELAKVRAELMEAQAEISQENTIACMTFRP